jgi:hypothetical protein
MRYVNLSSRGPVFSNDSPADQSRKQLGTSPDTAIQSAVDAVNQANRKPLDDPFQTGKEFAATKQLIERYHLDPDKGHQTLGRWQLPPDARDAQGRLLGGRNLPPPCNKEKGSRAPSLWRVADVLAWERQFFKKPVNDNEKPDA